MEKRLLLAAVLSLGVLFLWEAIAARNAPRPGAASPTPSSAMAAAPSVTTAGAVPATAAAASTVSAGQAQSGPASAASIAPVSASAEHTEVLQNDFVRATFSNRGGVLVSYVLLHHTDEEKRALELVRQLPPPAPRPLAIDFPTRPELTQRIAAALFVEEPLGTNALRLRFSDGTVAVTKE